MRGLIPVATILIGLVLIGYSLDNSPAAVAAPDRFTYQFAAGQAALGACVVVLGLVSLRRY